jgi:hypothetical protein
MVNPALGIYHGKKIVDTVVLIETISKVWHITDVFYL